MSELSKKHIELSREEKLEALENIRLSNEGCICCHGDCEENCKGECKIDEPECHDFYHTTAYYWRRY